MSVFRVANFRLITFKAIWSFVTSSIAACVTVAVLVGASSSHAGVCDGAGFGQQIPADTFRPHSSFDNDLLGMIQWDYVARAQIACNLREAILNKYALINLKKERIGLDIPSHLEQCAQEEWETQDDSSLDFRDRMIKCVAAIKDTHLGLRTQGNMPLVFTGIVLNEIDGKFYIASRYEKLLEYVRDRTRMDGLLERLSVGNEVTEVEGRSPAYWRDHFAQYVDSSSEGFGNIIAAIQIFSRDYQYPKKNSIDFKVVHKGKEHHIELPWWSADAAQRIDAGLHFKNVGIENLEWIKWEYNPNSKGWKSKELKRTGYSYGKPLYPESQLTTYVADNGSPGLRVGQIIESADKVFCYMQLSTFSSNELTRKGEDKGEPFMDPIRRFITDCEKKKLPLVFDLRSNGGGYGSYPPKLLAMLTETGKEYPGMLTSFVTSKHSGWLISRVKRYEEIAARYLSEFSSWNYLVEAYQSAVWSGSSHLPLVKSKSITEDEAIGGYNQKIVALVTPICISACDIMSNLLKTAERATLVGTHSNGTGAGFMTFDGADSNWKDSYDMFSLRIPNFLFGVASDLSSEVMLDFEANKQLTTENLPVQADIQYSTSLDDITGKGKGWREAAMKALFGKPSKVVGKVILAHEKTKPDELGARLAETSRD